MKENRDEAVAEVRSARKALCDRFGNDARRLLAHLRAEQRRHHGRIVKNWSELQFTDALHESRTSAEQKRK